MARKDFDEYYANIYKQYNDLQKTLADMSKEVEDNIVEPERVDNLKKLIEPIKTSYQILTTVKYLLDRPKRKNKVKAYENRSNKFINIAEDNTKEGIINRNKNIIQTLKDNRIWGNY